MEPKEFRIGLYKNYLIIGTVSLIMLLFIPMLGTELGLAFRVPNTTAGWIVYIATKVIIAAFNLVIFHCFILQGKQNISASPQYLEAQKILGELEDKEYIPESPKEWTIKTYGFKGTTLFLMSILSAFSLSQAILTFDTPTFLTYLFTLAGGLLTGWIQKDSTENWWTIKYLQYARYKLKEQQNDRSKQQNSEKSGRAGAVSDGLSCGESGLSAVGNQGSGHLPEHKLST